MEIGSVYEINPLIAEEAGRKSGRKPQLEEVLKYDKQNTVYTASGREAIALALYSLEKENPFVCKKCLMPAYMCDTVFIPFVQMGWELVFYHIDKKMRADEEELCRLISEYKPGMLFIHAYYGVDTWKKFRKQLKEYQKDGLLLMEDVTQSYYLHMDNHADYIVGSIRKWYAVPDGGFVATDHVLCREVVAYDESFAMRRLDMLTSKWKYLEEKQNRKGLDAVEKQRWVEMVLPRLVKEKEEYLAANRQLEDELDHFEGITGLSGLASNILETLEETEAEKRRKENYHILKNGLQNKKSLALVFTENDEEAAPLYMPVYMANRDALQKYLRDRDIYVPVLWPVGMENARVLTEDEEYIFSHLAAVPMDQRYGEEEMERIIDVIEEYEAFL